MKALVLFSALIILFASCNKNDDDIDPVIIISYDSLNLKAYKSIYTNTIEGVDYMAFRPSDTLVFAAIDIDDVIGADLYIRIGSSVFSQSPHFMLQQYGVSIEAIDTSKFAFAMQSEDVWSGVKVFPAGSAVNADSHYSPSADIDVLSVGNTVTNRGNIFIGIRKKTDQGEFRYGYLNLIVEMAEATILSSKLRNDGAECIVE